jgi:hypothetical protein
MHPQHLIRITPHQGPERRLAKQIQLEARRQQRRERERPVFRPSRRG